MSRLTRSLVLGEDVFATARQQRRKGFARELLAHCEKTLPQSFVGTAPKDRLPIIESYIESARASGLTQRGPIHVWAEASILLGAHFMHDPLCKPARTVFQDAGLAQMTQARRLHSVLATHTEAAIGSNGAILLTALRAFEERLLSGGAPGVADIADSVWPERFDLAGECSRTAFVEHVSNAIEKIGDVDAVNRVVLAACCLFFGAWAWSDPLRPWLAKAITHPMNAGEETVLFRVSREFFEGAKERLEAAQCPGS